MAGALALALIWASSRSIEGPVHVVLGGSWPEYAVSDLLDRSDAVALVTPVGTPDVRWNAADNKPWALDQLGRRSHIFRDQTMKVLATLVGKLPADKVVVRGVGGTIDNITVEDRDEPELLEGAVYLVFLAWRDTPTREGSEPAWTIVWQENGVFSHLSGDWTNAVGKTISAAMSELGK